MRVTALFAFAAGAILGLNASVSAAQQSGQIRLQCAGTFTASHLTTGPNTAKMASTFVVDFDNATVTDLADNASETAVQLNAESTDFKTASGAVEHISRADGAWTVSGTDGTIKGSCNEVANKNAF
jgi:hypothetical protein